jgi:hypothetical protein
MGKNPALGFLPEPFFFPFSGVVFWRGISGRKRDET